MLNIWFLALGKQIKPVLDEIDESTVRQLAGRVSQLITEEAIAEAMIATIDTVAPYFASQTFRDVKKALPDQRQLKQDIPTDEEWIQRINAILGTQAGVRITSITNHIYHQYIPGRGYKDHPKGIAGRCKPGSWYLTACTVDAG
jgi:hypothetical protein